MTTIDKHPTLYKITSTGKVQIWYQEIEGDKYRTVSGQEDGAKVTSEWKTAKPKNVGKANATTGEQQAELEVKANYTKRLDRDYTADKSKMKMKSEAFKPMLAKGWDDYKHKNEICAAQLLFTQPKLDGFRCIATVDGLFSRTGKRIVSVPHIEQQLASYFIAFPDLILDGELYNHDYKDDFNTLCSAIKKQKVDHITAARSLEIVQYHIYDVGSLPNDRFEQRTQLLQKLITVNDYIHLVPTIRVDRNLHSQIDQYNSLFVEQGYEGQMIRLNGRYETKRTKNLLKRKEFFDEEFEIVEIEQGQGNWYGCAKKATLRMKDGTVFGAGIAGDRPFLKAAFKQRDQYVGKLATVRYLNLTPDGVPRHGVVKELNRTDI